MAEQMKEQTGFVGVNLRQARTVIQDTEVAKALNVDFNKELGTASIRSGRTVQFTLNDAIVRLIAKVNGVRYQVAGRAVYRNGVSITAASGVAALATDLITDIEGMRPLNDSQIWAFIADTGPMQKDNGTVTRKWGIATPSIPEGQSSAFKLFTQGIANPAVGTYIYSLTHIRFDTVAATPSVAETTKVAHEGNPVSETITVEAYE